MERLDNTAEIIWDAKGWDPSIDKEVILKEVAMRQNDTNPSKPVIESLSIPVETGRDKEEPSVSQEAERRLIGYIVSNREKINEVQDKVEKCNERISDVQQEVVKCNDKIDCLNKEVKQLDKKVDCLDQKVDFHHQETLLRFEKMEQKFDTKYDQLDQKFDTKYDHLDQKIDTKFDQLDQKIDTKFDQLDQKIDVKFDLAMEAFKKLEGALSLNTKILLAMLTAILAGLITFFVQTLLKG